ncbi:kunitz-type protease inhibitor 2 isoform X2 [Gallus gallus]|uniref:BPTI/Kunitz inhibitor domain-containing protein n=1 Tax=Gallus gallus TaxID=9031 RepID=A0A8V0Y0V6_CHICK|nr:kunitz-type protease inhibitor 2 isoform X1 [Gallus gallus]XP_040550125.1 kunitz-type protease inhibitor 2 isoform X2 [Gallus gallus]
MAAGPVLALLLLLPAGGGGVPGGPGSDAPSKAPPPDITAPWDSAYEELCAAPPLTGPCRAAFHRWFYSPQHRQCRPFIYGGCRGNRNNYRDREECLQRCGGGDGSSWHPTAVLLAVLLLAVLLLALLALLLTRPAATQRCHRRSRGADKERLMGSEA